VCDSKSIYGESQNSPKLTRVFILTGPTLGRFAEIYSVRWQEFPDLRKSYVYICGKSYVYICGAPSKTLFLKDWPPFSFSKSAFQPNGGLKIVFHARHKKHATKVPER
jgi:hypothetical protein